MMLFVDTDWAPPYFDAKPAATAPTKAWTPVAKAPSIPESIGAFFIRKYRERVAKSGVRAAAVQLRKHGVPIEIALAILVGRRIDVFA